MDKTLHNPAAAIAVRAGKAGAAFDKIRLDYPPQTAAFAGLLEVYHSAANRSPYRPCGGALLVAPYGSGKTVALQMLRDSAAEDAGAGTSPVLLVEMSTSGTVESLPTSILLALNQPRAEAGSEKARWARAIAEIERSHVCLVVFDEFNRASRRNTMSKPIVTTIREKIMDSGVAAVALVGSDEASIVLRSCPEMVQRLDDHIDLSPLDTLIPEDMADLKTFLGDLDSELASPKLLGGLSYLNDEDIAVKLCRATGGRIRGIMKIIRAAMLSALRDGRTAIDEADLYSATDIMAVRQNLVAVNPFAVGA